MVTIYILVFAAVFLFVLASYLLILDLKQAHREKLVLALRATAGTSQELEGHKDAALPRGWLPRLGRALLKGDYLDILRQLFPSGITLRRLLLPSLTAALFFSLLPLLFFPHPMLVFLTLAAGLALPVAALKLMGWYREESLVAQLPEALDAMVRCLRVGQTVDAAILEVARSFPPPLGEDFRLLHEEMALGLPFETALKNLQQRYPKLADLRILCVAFIIQRETGGKLIDILAGLAATIRDRLRLKRRVQAASAEGRTTAVILGVLPLCFGVFTWALKPDYMRVFLDHPLGRKLFLVILALEVTGFLLMQSLARIKV